MAFLDRVRRRVRGSLGLIGLLALAPQAGWAAPLHRPLPADSLEQNGDTQVLRPHPLLQPPPPALPGGGLHPRAAAGLRRVYSGTPIDVLTYQYTNLRTGWNSRETELTPANVGSAAFGQIATLSVDGLVLSQPLMVSNYKMPNGSVHNLLIVATSNNSVYAFDAQTYAILWKVNLGQNQSSSDVGCVDLPLGYGISSTPVIVRRPDGAATIFVVAATEPAHLSFHTTIHALDAGAGADVVTPREIDPRVTLPAGGTIYFDPQDQWNRVGLAAGEGSIYVGVGSHCDEDKDASTGWLLAYDTSLKLEKAFNTIDSATGGLELASIWMSGFAPAIDAVGDVFVVTGNGAVAPGASAPNYGQSVLSLKAGLSQVLTTFTPASYNLLNQHDTDFGSGGVMLLPSAPGQTALAVAMGKDATLYLLNAASLGGLHSGDSGALQAQRLAPSGQGLWGGPAYYGATNGGRVYVQINDDVLRAFSVSTGAHPALTQVATGTSTAGYGGSIPVVSSDGTRAGTAIVWLVRRASTPQLEAYDAAKLGNPIFAANAGPPAPRPLVSPLVANGRVYVPGKAVVTVFGLTGD